MVNADNATEIHLLGEELYVVTYKWLLDSLKKGEVLSEYDYWASSVVACPSHVGENDTTHVENADETTYLEPDRFVV